MLWAVNQITYKQDNRQERFIVCYLLRSSKDCGWGYKDVTEGMFPYQFSCPLKYLDMAPVANEKWRAEVRAYHERRNRKVQIGQKIGLVNDVYTDADAVYAAALEMAEEIAANAPLAVRGTKFVLQQGENMTTEQSLLLNGLWTMMTSLNSNDLKEAMQAFMEKRPASFTGT